MKIDSRFKQPWNAWLPIETTVLGMIVALQPTTNSFVDDVITALQLFLESYVILSGSTTMLDSSEQPEKAMWPIDMTDLGMIVVLRSEQSSKA